MSSIYLERTVTSLVFNSSNITLAKASSLYIAFYIYMLSIVQEVDARRVQPQSRAAQRSAVEGPSQILPLRSLFNLLCLLLNLL